MSGCSAQLLTGLDAEQNRLWVLRLPQGRWLKAVAGINTQVELLTLFPADFDPVTGVEAPSQTSQCPSSSCLMRCVHRTDHPPAVENDCAWDGSLKGDFVPHL